MIGGVGHTGDAAGTPNHLHFQVRAERPVAQPVQLPHPAARHRRRRRSGFRAGRDRPVRDRSRRAAVGDRRRPGRADRPVRAAVRHGHDQVRHRRRRPVRRLRDVGEPHGRAVDRHRPRRAHRRRTRSPHGRTPGTAQVPGRGPRRRFRRPRDARQRLRRRQRPPGAEGGHERRWTPTPTATASATVFEAAKGSNALSIDSDSRRPDRRLRVGGRHPGARGAGRCSRRRGAGPGRFRCRGRPGRRRRRVRSARTRWPRARPAPGTDELAVADHATRGGSMATLSPSQIYTLLLQGGFIPDEARMMTAIAQAESAAQPRRGRRRRAADRHVGAVGGAVPDPHPQGGDRHRQRPRHPAPDEQPRRAGQGGAEHLERRQQPPARGAPTPTARTGSSSTSRCRRASAVPSTSGAGVGPSAPAWARLRHGRGCGPYGAGRPRPSAGSERRRPVRDGPGAPAVRHHGPGRRRADRRLREALRHGPDEGRLRRRRPDRRHETSISHTDPLSADTDRDGHHRRRRGRRRARTRGGPTSPPPPGPPASAARRTSTPTATASATATSRSIGTDPLLADTDHDGLSDGDEIARGLNPRLLDSNNDGLADGFAADNDLLGGPAGPAGPAAGPVLDPHLLP